MSACANTLLVCVKGKSCARKHSRELFHCLAKVIAKLDLKEEYRLEKAECFGLCRHGPIVAVANLGLFYSVSSKKEGKKIFERHLTSKKPVKSLLVRKGKKKRR